jgi:hypothetical protein
VGVLVVGVPQDGQHRFALSALPGLRTGWIATRVTGIGDLTRYCEQLVRDCGHG